MPMNQPKNYSFTPYPTGEVKLISRSSRRSRLWAGGSFWRSVDRGESTNHIKISCLESGEEHSKRGLLVVQNDILNTYEQVQANGFLTDPNVRLTKINLKWNEEIRLIKEGGTIRAKKYGISWQIAGETLLTDMGEVTIGKLFAVRDVVFMVHAEAWPDNATITIKPRVHRYHLVQSEVTDPLTAISSVGWDIKALRATLNESDTWVKMPKRQSTSVDGSISGSNEDEIDDGADALFLEPFDFVSMSGGDGLPANPAGYNTGPFRTLVHLNYAERDNGSMGEVNQVYEWVGNSSAEGSWKLY